MSILARACTVAKETIAYGNLLKPAHSFSPSQGFSSTSEDRVEVPRKSSGEPHGHQTLTKADIRTPIPYRVHIFRTHGAANNPQLVANSYFVVNVLSSF